MSGGAREGGQAVSGDADRWVDGRGNEAGDEVFAWELGSSVAGRRCDVRVHVFARGPSSRADSDAGASVGPSHSTQRVGKDLAVGLVVEGSGTKDATKVIHADILIGSFPPIDNHSLPPGARIAAEAAEATKPEDRCCG